MRKPIRPSFTAGLALIGASTLAITPVIATPPDIAIANPDVQLSASPIDPYLAIFARARANAEALLDGIHGLREGIRTAVMAPTGRGDDNRAGAAGGTDESP